MYTTVENWCDAVALEAFRAPATDNGLRVIHDMIAALLGAGPAMATMESAARMREREEEMERRGRDIAQRRETGVRFQ
jgi:hypothetical protein